MTRFDSELALLSAVRGHEIAEQLGRTVPVLGIGHLVDPDGIDYRYVFQDPPLDVPDELRRTVEDERGILDLAQRAVVPPPKT
jgi:hypothetical protein